jgi:TIR domain
MSSTKHVFLSYALEDRELAKDLASLMSRRGASVFSDFDVKLGELWSSVIRDEIEKSSALVLLISSDGFRNRNNIWFEAGALKHWEREFWLYYLQIGTWFISRRISRMSCSLMQTRDRSKA